MVDAGTPCVVGTPASCATPTSILTCTSGLQSTTACTLGRACVATDGGASCACVRQGRLGCFQDDVYEFDSCGNRLLPIVQDCIAGQGERCFVDNDRATCRRPQTCNAQGSGCAVQDYCFDGGCYPDVCDSISTTGMRPGCNGQNVVQCRATGSGFDVLDTCVNGEQCVVLTGLPWAQCRCVANARRGCSNNDIYQYDSCGVRGSLVQACVSTTCVEGASGATCVPNTTCTVDTNCSSGNLCESGRCVPRTCTPGTTRCEGNDVQRCDTRGAGYEPVTTCSNGAVCTTSGTTASCTCTPNAYQGCALGDVFQFNSCGVRGSLVTDCVSPEVCTPGATPSCRNPNVTTPCLLDSECGANRVCIDSRCSDRVCAPNTTFCSAGAVRLCDGRGADSVLVTDCLDGTQCVAAGSSASCRCVAQARQGCSNGDVFWFDSCNARTDLVADCSATQTCTEVGSLARCVSSTDAGVVDAGPSCTPNATIDCYAGDRYFFDSCGQLSGVAEVCQGAVSCWELDGGAPECRSSVADRQSPYWERSCPLVQQVSNQTTLPADCRCTSNRPTTGGIDRCVGSTVLPLTTRFGSGPSIRSLPQAHYNGGVIVGRELFVGADWSSSVLPNQGLVMAIHLDTGNRRIVSGAFDDPATGLTTTGTGPAFANVIDVKRGVGPELYVLSVPGSSFNLEILRVDPVTGNRTLVWRGRDAAFGQCASGDSSRPSVTYHERVFGLTATGDFYLGFRGAGFTSEGVGLVKVSANGQACSFVTRSGAGSLNAYAYLDIGQGFAVDRGFYAGLSEQSGQLYVLHDTIKALFRIDPATGNRTRVSGAGTAYGILGDGPINLGGIGERWTQWDSTRNVMWTSGVLNYRSLVAVDLTTGDRTQAYCSTTGGVDAPNAWRQLCLSGVLAAGYQNFGGLFLDPVSGDLFVVHDNHSLTRLDLINGNSMRFSL